MPTGFLHRCPFEHFGNFGGFGSLDGDFSIFHGSQANFERRGYITDYEPEDNDKVQFRGTGFLSFRSIGISKELICQIRASKVTEFCIMLSVTSSQLGLVFFLSSADHTSRSLEAAHSMWNKS